MNKFKKIALGCTICIIAFYFISPITLDKGDDRPNNTYAPDLELKTEIKRETASMTSEQIRKYSIRKTADLLSFHAKKNLAKGEANCVGYAQMCAGIANYAFHQNGLSCHAKPVVGCVRFLGINVCFVLQSCLPNQRLKNL